MRFVLTKVRAETLRPLRHGPVSRRRPSSETQCVTTHAKRRQALSDTPPWAAAPLVCSGATGQQPRGANTCGCSTAELAPWMPAALLLCAFALEQGLMRWTTHLKANCGCRRLLGVRGSLLRTDTVLCVRVFGNLVWRFCTQPH